LDKYGCAVFIHCQPEYLTMVHSEGGRSRATT
jgi:hypothetical protein